MFRGPIRFDPQQATLRPGTCVEQIGEPRVDLSAGDETPGFLQNVAVQALEFEPGARRLHRCR